MLLFIDVILVVFAHTSHNDVWNLLSFWLWPTFHFKNSGHVTDKMHCKTDRANYTEKTIGPFKKYSKQNTLSTRYRFLNATTLKNTIEILKIDFFTIQSIVRSILTRGLEAWTASHRTQMESNTFKNKKWKRICDDTMYLRLFKKQ